MKTHLLELVRYIHLNPLRAGLVSSMRQLESYRWTGHAGIMGRALMPGQAADQVLLMFDEHRKRAQEKYRNFVAEGIVLGRRDELVGGGIKRQLKLSGSNDFQAYDERILGSGQFVEHLLHETESAQVHEEVSQPSLQEIVVQISTLYGIESSALRQGSKQKTIANAKAAICFLATRRFGYTGVQVARCLALSRSGVILAAGRGDALYAMTDKLRDLFPGSNNNSTIHDPERKEE